MVQHNQVVIAEQTRSWKHRLFSALRIGLSLSLIGVLLWFVDVAQVLSALANADPTLTGVTLMWLFLDRVIMAYRWDILLRAKNIIVPLAELTKIYFIGSFWGLFLPSSLAPDAVRVYLAARSHKGRASEMFSSIFIDRFVGLAVLLAMAGIAVLILLMLQQAAFEASTSTLVIAASLSLPALFWLWGRLPKPEAIPQGFAGRLGEKLHGVYASCYIYRQKERVLAQVALLALANHTGAILSVYLLSLALGIQMGVLYFFLFIPLITIFTMIPVSVGGLGVQEGAFVYLFSLVGMPLTGALALSLLLRVLSMVAALPGGFFLLPHGKHRLTEGKG